MVILNAILLGLEGKKAEVLRQLEKIKDQVTPKQYRVLETSIDMLHFLQRLDTSLDPKEENSERADLLAKWLKILPDIHSIWPSVGTNISDKPEVGAGQLLQIPPVLNRSLVEMMKAMAAAALNPGGKDTHRKLDLVLRQHPEGLLYFFHGVLLFQQGQITESRLQLLTSLRTPAIGNVRRTALSMIVVCEMKLLAAGGAKDEILIRESAQHLKELLNLGSLSADEVELCVPLAFMVGDYHLVRDLTALAERMKTKNLQDILVVRLKAEEAIGNFTGLLATAEKMLKVNPKDEVAIQYRALALKNLQEIVRLAGGKG